MLDRYFFIPADKPKFLSKMKDLKPEYFVIDMEESVSNKNKNMAIDNIAELDIPDNCFVRIPFLDDILEDRQIQFLTKKFEGRVVSPKIRTKEDIQRLISSTDSTITLSLIILVENPQCLYNLEKMFLKYADIIHGIGLGSHDFCTEMGMRHEKENLSYYKNKMIFMAKAFNSEYIDGVDLDIKDLTNYKDECLNAYNSGANGKFIIHPNQLEALKEIPFFRKEEIIEMKGVHRMASSMDADEIDILEYNGKYYEKPHLKRINEIINRLNRLNEL